jgi:gluconolactonase
VALSPDESTLYVSNTESGEILAWDVAPDGSLSNPRTFAAGLTIPDGLCVDQRGHVYVATWGEGLVVFSPSGAQVVILPVDAPATPTNCAFGGDGRDLWVTAQTGLYRTRTLVPGS